MSDKFIMRPEHELMHRPDGSVNFNESAYTNAFDTTSPVGGWMRLGNRVNEGYAELSVCLYLPDGRIACQFQRPSINSNDRFDAGGLSYEVIEPLRRVSMTWISEVRPSASKRLDGLKYSSAVWSMSTMATDSSSRPLRDRSSCAASRTRLT